MRCCRLTPFQTRKLKILTNPVQLAIHEARVAEPEVLLLDVGRVVRAVAVDVGPKRARHLGGLLERLAMDDDAGLGAAGGGGGLGNDGQESRYLSGDARGRRGRVGRSRESRVQRPVC